MGWVLLNKVLRNSNVLNDWLSILLSCGLDNLWAHKFVFKGLLIFCHSVTNDLDVLLKADKRDDKNNE
jgi:hypothetical protein